MVGGARPRHSAPTSASGGRSEPLLVTTGIRRDPLGATQTQLPRPRPAQATCPPSAPECPGLSACGAFPLPSRQFVAIGARRAACVHRPGPDRVILRRFVPRLQPPDHRTRYRSAPEPAYPMCFDDSNSSGPALVSVPVRVAPGWVEEVERSPNLKKAIAPAA
jgi:hypothetical protein